LVGNGIIDLLQQYIVVASGIAQIAIVFLLWRTVRDFSETGKVSRIQVEHRFRPWVGPSSGIELVRTANSQHQYAITIKNYGQIPASKVTALFTMKNDVVPTRDLILNPSEAGIERFILGPLLPSMEKKYWIFIDSDLVQRTKNGNRQVFIVVYFAYEFAKEERSGYGMISHLNSDTGSFVHKDMWID
jgi:hypothetical protein